MKIALVAPPIERVPPRKYGGTERIVHTLAEELVKRGHKVTLFASADSKTSAKLVPTIAKGLREIAPNNPKLWFLNTMLHLSRAYSQHKEFDIIHDHTGFYGASYANCVSTPTLITLHGVLNEQMIKSYKQHTKPYLVTISHAQALPEPNLNFIGNVYNGLDMSSYPFSATHDGYLLYVGRICPEKGTAMAVQIAKKLNMKLIIAAKLEPHLHGKYFEKYIKPFLGEQIRWIGEVNEAERNLLYSKALCLLHPINWQEPFGLTLIEAMACGCPVISFNLGSIPEIIVHGKTGFIARDAQGMAYYISKVTKINRYKCREHVLNKFSATQMTDDYELIYYEILQQKINLSQRHIEIFQQNYLP